jgi:tetratricopeptide (TPR) repeat protein
MPLRSRISRISIAALAAVAVFLALTLAIRMKDRSIPSAGKGSQGGAPQVAEGDGEAQRRHEVMALQAELQKKPNHVPILFRLAQLARESGKTPEAISHLRKILELEPKNSEARIELSRDLYETGDVAGALNQTRQILADNPQQVDALYNIGAIYANLNQASQAREYWRRAVASAPGSESGQRAAEGLQHLGPAGQLPNFSAKTQQ